MKESGNKKLNRAPIAIFIEDLSGGGVEKTCLKLAKGFHDRGYRVDLLVRSLKGAISSLIPEEINVVNFSTSRMITTIYPLANYLRKEKPTAIISNDSHVNVVTLMARGLVRKNRTRLILTERTDVSPKMKNSFKQRIILSFMRRLYPRADAIIGVSNGLSRDLEKCIDSKNKSVETIYNGIVDDDFYPLANEPLDHKWIKKADTPVILAVGRLVEQKDFSNLLRAFALLRKKRSAKLIILGEGRLRSLLEKQIIDLGLREDVQMSGFELNPLKYYKNCSAFVLSSQWEGLGGVIIEALACGCPVVATDCPSGPDEILEGGKYGTLVPIGDSHALAEAIGKTLDSPPDPSIGIERANKFSVDSAVSNYLSVLKSLDS
jgi:glycosyltransferase involved in cell wall biosynthesis